MLVEARCRFVPQVGHGRSRRTVPDAVDDVLRMGAEDAGAGGEVAVKLAADAVALAVEARAVGQRGLGLGQRRLQLGDPFVELGQLTAAVSDRPLGLVDLSPGLGNLGAVKAAHERAVELVEDVLGVLQAALGDRHLLREALASRRRPVEPPITRLSASLRIPLTSVSATKLRSSASELALRTSRLRGS
ncbi:MAG: hypothetical protein ACRD2W_04500 [Acidimicrobiales bacterium]